MRRAPLIRLPQSFLILILIFSFGAAVISGGIAYSQGSGGAGWAGVDLTLFKGCCAAFVLTVLIWRFAPIGWIGDTEINKMETAEFAAEIQSESGLRFALFKIKFWIYLAALVAIGDLIFAVCGIDFMGPKWLDINSRTRDGGSGAAFMGFTLGSFHILGKDWTGIELAIIVPLVILLGATVWKGFAHVVKANRPKAPPPG